MQRILIAAGALLLAAFAIWHLAPRSSQAFVAQSTADVPPRTRAVSSPASVVVYVIGAVAHPGLYRLDSSALRGSARSAIVRSARSARAGRGRSRRLPPASAVDLNGADAAALAQLPGIGPTLAARIVAYRDLNGPFASADELLDVAGITPGRLDRIAPYLVVR